MKNALQIFAAGSLMLSAGAQAQVRAVVGHFAPFADTAEGTSVTINVNGATALENVVFGDFTDYLELGAAGTYDVEIIPTGATDPAITFSADLADGDYTLLAIGDGSNQALELLPLVDDNTPPEAGNIKLRVVHAAPFADTLEGTNVSIRTAGGDVIGGLNSVPFKGSSQFLALPAATYDVKVSSPDGSANFIDPLPVALAEGAIVTVVATGDGTNQSLGIVALPVGELPTRVPVDVTAAGTFFDPSTDGQGGQLFALPSQNRVIGFIYAFNDDGSQAWYQLDTGPGGFDGVTGDFTVFQAEGGAFGMAMPEAMINEVGDGTLTFSSCDEVSISGEFGTAGSVTLNYERLTPGYACSAAFTTQ